MSSEKSILTSSEEANQYAVPVPDWHWEIIEERLSRYQARGMQGTPLEEFEKELIEELKTSCKD